MSPLVTLTYHLENVSRPRCRRGDPNGAWPVPQMKRKSRNPRQAKEARTAGQHPGEAGLQERGRLHEETSAEYTHQRMHVWPGNTHQKGTSRTIFVAYRGLGVDSVLTEAEKPCNTQSIRKSTQKDMASRAERT